MEILMDMELYYLQMEVNSLEIFRKDLYMEMAPITVLKDLK